MAGTHSPQDITCLSQTCLRWTPEGELAREDFQHVLSRLAAVDRHGAELQVRASTDVLHRTGPWSPASP